MQPSLYSTDDAEQPCHSIDFSQWCMTFTLTHFLDILLCTYWNVTHFRDRFGPIVRFTFYKTTATRWWLFTL